jgi:diguanylate cyclase (GGDEF)-like protein/PAS domain S-box-containing protein
MDQKVNLADLQGKIEQQEKIINALMKRVEANNQNTVSDFNMFNQAAVLERQVTIKTKEYKGVAEALQKKTNELDGERASYLNLLNSLQDFVCIITQDKKLAFINAPPLKAVGLTLDELKGTYLWKQRWFDFDTAKKGLVEQSIKDALLGKTTVTEVQIKVEKNKKGRLFWVRYVATPIRDEDEKIVSVLVEGVSIHKLKQAELELQEEKERFQTTLESIGDAVIATDKNCLVTYMNPVAESLTGWREHRAIGKPLEKVFFIINEVTGEAAKNPARRCIAEGRILGLANHTGLIHKDGHTISIEDSAAPIRQENGEISGAVLVFHDVSKTRSMAKELEFHANYDALTGLVNRRQFEDRLNHSLTSIKRDHRDSALLYLDLDQFKLINDTCGHSAGDELLKLLVGLIKPRMREKDTFARLGGDEFGILLENCPANKALEIANELRKMIEEFRYASDDVIFNLGVSIGIVNLMDIWDIEAVDPLKLADTACYAAKDSGRNRVHVYEVNDEEFQKRQGEMSWVSKISSALDNDQFVLFYQPIVGIQGECKSGIEVLLRMVDSKTGDTIPPGVFLPAAERYDLMEKLDRWVVKHTLDFFEQQADYLDAIDYCSINLSGQSIGDENFLRFIQGLFIKSKVPYKKIAFEVTETAAIQNLHHAKIFMQQMQALGCEFFLDDFGSGMSSFGYLKQLPVQKLKIDGLFVRDIHEDPVDYAMVKSINDVGHAVGMQTVAEFVETQEVMHLLHEMGVDYAQGYGLAKPSPLNDFDVQLFAQLTETVQKSLKVSVDNKNSA